MKNFRKATAQYEFDFSCPEEDGRTIWVEEMGEELVDEIYSSLHKDGTLYDFIHTVVGNCEEIIKDEVYWLEREITKRIDTLYERSINSQYD